MKHIKFNILWNWWDIGIVFQIYRTVKSANYHFCIDIQILWFNLWIQCWEKKKAYESKNN